MHTDTWAVSPAATDDSYFRAAAAIGGAGALTLLRSNFAAAGAINGCGYKITINSTGNDSGTTYTIVGTIVGQMSGTTTVTQAGGNTGTATTSTNYWASINSITASGAATGDVKIGFVGGTTSALALPRTRILGVYYVGAAAAGSIVVTQNSTSGTVLLNVDTVGSATFSSYVATGSILTARSSAQTDFALVTLTQVTKCTLICA